MTQISDFLIYIFCFSLRNISLRKKYKLKSSEKIPTNTAKEEESIYNKNDTLMSKFPENEEGDNNRKTIELASYVVIFKKESSLPSSSKYVPTKGALTEI